MAVIWSVMRMIMRNLLQDALLEQAQSRLGIYIGKYAHAFSLALEETKIVTLSS